MLDVHLQFGRASRSLFQKILEGKIGAKFCGGMQLEQLCLFGWYVVEHFRAL